MAQYAEGMILSSGQCNDLPKFHKIVIILINAQEVTFICRTIVSRYIEHLRSYELVEGHLSETVALDPNLLTDYHPLEAYKVGGKLNVTTRTFILN